MVLDSSEDKIQVFYGLTNYIQLKHFKGYCNPMVSARFLISKKPSSVLFTYLKQFDSIFLDSGAFGSAASDGGYKYSVEEYAALVERVRPSFWAAMDYPCEPTILTGMATQERIEKTIENTIALKKYNIPGFVPVIQGWKAEDYEICIELMAKHNLLQGIMGIGSICRRGSQDEIFRLIRWIHAILPAVKFHAFGIKLNALTINNGELQNYLHSIDTAAWQFNLKVRGKQRPKRSQEYIELMLDYDKRLQKRLKTRQLPLGLADE